MKYRVIQILRAATDGCCSQPWLAGPPPNGPSNCHCSQHSLCFSVTVILVILWTHLSMQIKPRLITKKFILHPVLQSLPFLTPSYKIAVSYSDLADVTRAKLEFYMASVSVILLLFVQTTQILLQFPVIHVLEIFGRYVLISRQSHLRFLL